MQRVLLFATLLIPALVSTPGADFSRDIAPILQSKCLTCHSAEKAKGGYRVHTFAAVLRPGKSKEPAVVPNEPDQSELFKRLITRDEDDRMPQEDDSLPSAQIELFREWIAAGATLDRGEPQSTLALLIPRADHPAPPQFYSRPLPILAIAFTPDGQHLAVSGHHEINFWNLAGTLDYRVTNAPQRIHSISFSPSSNFFAIAGGKPGRSGEVSIYQDRAFLTNLVQHSDALLTVTFSPDGEFLAAGGSDNAIRIYKTDTWEKVSTIQQHADWVVALNFNSSSDKIVSASRDRTARVYDAESGELETTYTTHSAPVLAATFLEADRVASAGREKVIHLWDIKEGKRRNEISGASAEINGLISTEKFLFAASVDKHVRQYNISDRKLIRTYEGHRSPIFSIAFHPASSKLASGSYDGTVKIWNSKDGTLDSTFVAAPLLHANTSRRTNDNLCP